MSSHIDKLIQDAETIRVMLDRLITGLKATPDLTVKELLGMTNTLRDTLAVQPFTPNTPPVQQVIQVPQNTTSRIKTKGTKDRLLELLSTHKEGLDTDAIKRLFMETWGIQLTTDQVASSVTYLRGLNKIKRSENGRYFVV